MYTLKSNNIYMIYAKDFLHINLLYHKFPIISSKHSKRNDMLMEIECARIYKLDILTFHDIYRAHLAV